MSEQLNNLEKQVQQQAKIDTFSRFFLSNYYTGTKEDDKVQEKIKRFVDKETLKEFRGTEEKSKVFCLGKSNVMGRLGRFLT